MAESKIIRDDFGGLNNLVKALSKNLVVKVGILGNKASRKDANASINNAEIGAIQEFGSRTRNIPARSFLRMPIHHEAEKIVKDAAQGTDTMVLDGDIKGVMMRIGVACVAAIQKAFASAGFSQWDPNAQSTMRRKNSASPLIDTAQLRRSITFAVTKP